MDNTLINSNLLRSQMVLKGVSRKQLADAQGWSTTTVHRKIKGKSAFTGPEIQICVELLKLDSITASEIFFANKMS